MTRISVDEARTLWLEATDDELKRLAQEARARFHEPDQATYMVMRIINYTNVCVAQCDYCAFYVLPNQDGGYVLSREDVFAKIDELVESAATSSRSTAASTQAAARVLLRPLRRGARALRRECRVLRADDRRVRLPRRPRGLSYADAAARLRDAGVHWVTGGGSEILTEDFRKRHASASTRCATTSTRSARSSRAA